MKKSPKQEQGKDTKNFDADDQPLAPGMQRTREVNVGTLPPSDAEDKRFTPQEIGQVDGDRVPDIDNPQGAGGLRGPLNQEGQGNRQDDETAELRDVDPDLDLDDPAKS